MGWTQEGASATCVDELLIRFDRAANRIQGADYSGALKSLRYWDSGYDLGALPRAVRDQLEMHSRAARLCLTCGDTSGAALHVRDARALALSTREPMAVATVVKVPARRRQKSKSAI